MMGRRLRHFAVLLVVWCLFITPQRAELRSFKIPPNVLHMFEKGDGPDPFPWKTAGPIPPDASILNSDGDTNGDGWPTFEINGVTYEVECAFTINQSGERELAFSETVNGVWNQISVLTATTGVHEEDPAITSTPSGGSKIVFWRNMPASEIWMVERTSSAAAWSVPHKVSASSDPASYPSTAMAFGKVHIGYEVTRADGTKDIIVAGRLDNNPAASFQPEVIAHIGYTGKADVEVESHGAHLWVSWIQSATQLGWSSWQGGIWSPVQFENYSSQSGIEDTRNLIRREVESAQ